MLSIKLAFRNLTHAGLRTWLNVIVLSLSFVLIVLTQGLYDGMQEQMVRDMTNWDVAGGQLWHQAYDPYDPLTWEDAHAPVRGELKDLVEKGDATMILMTQAAIFPDGRLTNARLKGIDPDQTIIDIPSSVLANGSEEGSIPGLIGEMMARNTGLKIGDLVTVRWRDINGTFDAADVQIVAIMATTVQSIDNGHIWISLENLQEMMQMPGEASIITLSKNLEVLPAGTSDWTVQTAYSLLEEVWILIEMKKSGGMVFFAILVAMSLLAIFDSQVLAIFRRRKEMGTLMALGMTRGAIIRLFTIEGSLNGFLAVVIGAIYGIPFLSWFAKTGMSFPQETIDQFGMALAASIYPVYTLKLFLGTALLLFLTVVVVSFIPTRKITRLKPTDALRGKIS